MSDLISTKSSTLDRLDPFRRTLQTMINTEETFFPDYEWVEDVSTSRDASPMPNCPLSTHPLSRFKGSVIAKCADRLAARIETRRKSERLLRAKSVERDFQKRKKTMISHSPQTFALYESRGEVLGSGNVDLLMTVLSYCDSKGMKNIARLNSFFLQFVLLYPEVWSFIIMEIFCFASPIRKLLNETKGKGSGSGSFASQSDTDIGMEEPIPINIDVCAKLIYNEQLVTTSRNNIDERISLVHVSQSEVLCIVPDKLLLHKTPIHVSFIVNGVTEAPFVENVTNMITKGVDIRNCDLDSARDLPVRLFMKWSENSGLDFFLKRMPLRNNSLLHAYETFGGYRVTFFSKTETNHVVKRIWRQEGHEWGWSDALSSNSNTATHTHVLQQFLWSRTRTPTRYMMFNLRWISPLPELIRSLGNDNPDCSYMITGANHMLQPWFSCRTCALAGEATSITSFSSSNTVGCCLPCVTNCHSKHDVTFERFALCYCDCAAYIGDGCTFVDSLNYQLAA